MTPTHSEGEIGKAIVNACFKIHKALGPGLLEKIYEVCLAHDLSEEGYKVMRQVNIPINYDGIQFDEGLRSDILVQDAVIIEIKAVEAVNPVWQAQIISHLKLAAKNLGYLINFNVPLIKNGIKRYIN
ncbi:MAG: GxxExxY protein [Chitinophagaceae bacterium]|nr:GxxExxY protein [Chitinophagaceae bacterium]